MDLPQQSMKFDDMVAVFLREGVVESDSPKNRKQLHRYLHENRIPYRKEIIGATSGKRTGCRYGYGLHWDLGRVVRWIEAKRLLPKDLEAVCSDIFRFEDISEVFNEKMSNRERYALIKEKWGEDFIYQKYTPFDYCRIRKTIVRVTRA